MTDLYAPPAAVVGGSVVTFASGLPASHREDVYMSTAFAQRGTRLALADGLSGDWFEYYCNQLKFLGWDVPKPQTFSPIPGESMSKEAITRISANLGERFSTPLSRAMVELERNLLALDLFESTSLSAKIGLFQLIPCVMNGAHKVDMGIYHRSFEIQRSASRFLFIKNETLAHEGIEQMTSLTFNTLHYADFREKVKHSVLSQSLKYLEDLDI
ncbi:hypothetical protein NZ35_08485 [Pseudomonas chlororaphis]|uniref:Uncharacterized protein n=1 Tax=Pseudomonas chlororaphis TaxID=587753 RepID=A0A0A6FN54_9PSED|nr:hypothetical protein NZ35_08485 [Pseudomonas chlororaphis]